jgi:hypothetical protein
MDQLLKLLCVCPCDLYGRVGELWRNLSVELTVAFLRLVAAIELILKSRLQSFKSAFPWEDLR